MRCEHLVIEPQPLKCYKTANKRLRKQGLETFDLSTLSMLRGEGIEENVKRVIVGCGFEQVDFKGDQRTEWERDIVIFKRKNS